MSMKKISGKVLLREVLHDRSFEVDRAPEVRDLSGVLEASITVSPNRVKSGDKVLVNLSIKNASQLPINLSFVAHVGPMMDLTVTGPDSDGVVYPPPNPPLIARPGPPYSVGLTLMPGGEVFHDVEWEVVLREWTLDARSPVPIPLRGYESSTRPVGPLAPGRYGVQINAMFHYTGYGIEDPVGWFEVIL
jgi:hypothetical protein